MSMASSMGSGVSRGARRAVVHLLKAGVEVLKGVEAFFDEVSAAARGEDRDVAEEDQGLRRIPLD